MRLDARTLSYLDGSAFSNGSRFAVGGSPFVDRNELLACLVRDRVALHVGCADHVELIHEKRAADQYLHDRLGQAAAQLVGVDVNDAGLKEMASLGIPDLYKPADLPRDIRFDIVVAPDVIEHVPNVADFLASLKQHRCDVVVTTPNALGLSNRGRFRSELVNTDHRYWFSPYTLTKCLVASGYEICGMWYTDTFAKRQPLRSIVKRRYPLCRDGLAIRAAPRH
jgi:hypothetical protein